MKFYCTAAVVGGWLLSVVGLWCAMASYGLTRPASALEAATTAWPTGTALQLATDRATVVYCIHPRCPCTRASTRQLERLLHDTRNQTILPPRLLVLASCPAEDAEAFADTGITRAAAALPGAQLVLDPGGEQTSRLGARASGTVLIYSPAGKRLFHGGVTPARGHEGESLGAMAFRTALRDRDSAAPAAAPAFGCRLCLPHSDG